MSAIYVFTDFGPGGPYTGQVLAVLAARAPTSRVISLVEDAPAHAPAASGVLLAAVARDLPPGGVIMAVVDPGVGGSRHPVIVSAAERWLVGPDNGLLVPMARGATGSEAWRIDWRPPRLSDSFHGRDLFAPVAARLAEGAVPERDIPATPLTLAELVGWDEPPSTAQVIYIDPFGNAMTGYPAAKISRTSIVEANGHRLAYRRTFVEAGSGRPFWYENSLGLVEIAMDKARADKALGLAVGNPIRIRSGS